MSYEYETSKHLLEDLAAITMHYLCQKNYEEAKLMSNAIIMVGTRDVMLGQMQPYELDLYYVSQVLAISASEVNNDDYVESILDEYKPKNYKMYCYLLDVIEEAKRNGKWVISKHADSILYNKTKLHTLVDDDKIKEIYDFLG